MRQFKVTSHNFSGRAYGSTVEESDLAGLNIEALVEGGHLAAIGKPSPSKQPSEQKDN
jgi:hypothetical protein